MIINRQNSVMEYEIHITGKFQHQLKQLGLWWREVQISIADDQFFPCSQEVLEAAEAERAKRQAEEAEEIGEREVNGKTGEHDDDLL